MTFLNVRKICNAIAGSLLLCCLIEGRVKTAAAEPARYWSAEQAAEEELFAHLAALLGRSDENAPKEIEALCASVPLCAYDPVSQIICRVGSDGRLSFMYLFTDEVDYHPGVWRHVWGSVRLTRPFGYEVNGVQRTYTSVRVAKPGGKNKAAFILFGRDDGKEYRCKFHVGHGRGAPYSISL